jgi:hypothetical protein
MIKFKQKEYSLVENVLKGTLVGSAVGASVGTIANKLGYRTEKFPMFKEKRKEVWDKIDKEEKNIENLLRSKEPGNDKIFQKKIETRNNKIRDLKSTDIAYQSLGGAIIGASLGALWTAAEWVTNKFCGKPIINQCLDLVVTNLKKMGFKEGQHFTKDRRIADSLKTKITIAVVKTNGSLVVLVNSKNDPKLNKINKDIIRNLPTETVSQKENDRYNEITITSMSSNNGDSVFISSLAEKFIKAGFPVYLLEVSN